MTNQNFTVIFELLKSILQAYAPSLTVAADSDKAYSLDGPFSEKWKRNLFFGAAQIKKNYVSFYLMPIYMHPEMMNEISPQLKKRMQGKSCFNFKKAEPELFNELKELTRKGFARFREEK